MNFPLTFEFLLPPNSQEMSLFGLISTSIEKHEHSFAKLDQFKFNEKGKFANQQTKAYLTQLVSYSKKICSTPRKRPRVFEGMYGFVSRQYYYILDG